MIIRSEAADHRRARHAPPADMSYPGSGPGTRGTGIVKWKCAPPFGPFSPAMRPPCAMMIDWQMARPMPSPASLALKKLSKTCARSAEQFAKREADLFIVVYDHDKWTVCGIGINGHGMARWAMYGMRTGDCLEHGVVS